MKIAVLKETEAGELRVAATPETIRKYIGLGATVAVEKGAGEGASISDADYEAAGATLAASRTEVLKDADAVLAVQGPGPESLDGVKKGAWLIGALNPFGRRERVEAHRARRNRRDIYRRQAAFQVGEQHRARHTEDSCRGYGAARW